MVDPLEQRQLLSVSPADWEQILVNQRVIENQEMIAGRSVAVDKDGDFVVVWTRYDRVLDSAGNPVINPTTGEAMVDANIYARYFTDEVQRLVLPPGVLNDANANFARVTLVANGTEVQKLVLSATYEPYTSEEAQERIAGMIVFGYDLNRNGIIEEPGETTSFVFDESQALTVNARNLQTQLRGLGGDLTDVVVSPINPHEYLIEFRGASLGPTGVPRNVPPIQVLYRFSDLNPTAPGVQPPSVGTQFTSGFYPFAEVVTVREPVVLSNIAISPTDPARTAIAIEQAFWVTSTSLPIGPTELGQPPQPPSGSEGPVSVVPTMRVAVPTVSVTPVYNVPGRPDGTVFDITFTGASGKKDHPLLVVSEVLDENGAVLTGSSVTTLKEPSPEFRVNPEEPDDPFTLLPDRFNQTHAVVAMDADGDFVIVWQSEVPSWAHPTTVSDIYARRFRPAGLRDPASIDFLVDMNLDGVAEFPVQGVIALVSPEASIVQRLIVDATGAGPLAGNFRLRFANQITRNIQFDSTNLSGTASAIQAAMTAAGFRNVSVRVIRATDPYEFEISFTATFTGPNGRSDAILQYADPTTGTALGSLATVLSWMDPALDVYTFRVNQVVNGAQAQPAVAMDQYGNFTVVWGSGAQDISFFNSIKARRYDRFGAALGDEWMVNTEDTNEHRQPVVGMSEDGWAVIAWSMTPNRVANTVLAEIYDPRGTVRQNQFGIAGGVNPNVSFGYGGDWVITFNVSESDLGGADTSLGVRAIQYRLFDNEGNYSLQTVRSTFRINTADFDPATTRYWPFAQYGGLALLDADGDLVVVFDGFGPDVSEIEVDRLIENAVVAAIQAGQTPEEVGQLRAQLENAYRYLRGEGNGSLYSRFDADPLLGPMNILARDAVINSFRDGHNSRYYIAFDPSVDQGTFTLTISGPFSGSEDAANIQYQRTNLAASRANIESALRGLARTGSAWPSPFGQAVSVRLVPSTEVLLRFGTPWEIPGVFSTDIVFEITFQGSVHDSPIFLSGPSAWQGQTQATNELQLLQIFATGPGWFRLGIGGQATANMYFDPGNPQAVAALIQSQLRGIVTGVDANGNPIMPYQGVVVTYRPGTTNPYEFELNFVGASAGTNHPQVVQVALQGPPFPDPPLPGFIIGSTIVQGGSTTAPPPRLRHNQFGASGTIQESTSGGMEPDGDFTAVFVQHEEYTDGQFSNSNIYYRRFDESTDTAGPLVTDLIDHYGSSVPAGGVIAGPVQYIVLSFDDRLLAGDPRQVRDSVLNPQNYVLYRGDVEIPVGIAKVEFGMNMAAQLNGRPDGVDHDGDGVADGVYQLNPIPSNKWEAVLTLDGNGVVGLGTPALEAGDYRVVIRAPRPAQNISGLRDLAGNPLGYSGYFPAGRDMSFTFSVTVVSPDIRVDAPVSVAGRTFAETASAVARDADGDYVVVWTAFDPVLGVDRLYYRLFDADGTPADLPYLDVSGQPLLDGSGNIRIARDAFPALPVTPIASHPGFAGDTQKFGSVAMDPDGDIVVTWTNYRGGDADIYARRFDSMGGLRGISFASGSPVFNPNAPTAFRVNEFAANAQKWSDVAMDVEGNFVITWSSYAQESGGLSGTGFGVYARRYDVFGQPQGPEFRVNVTTAGNQQFSKVAMDAAGGFVIVWVSDHSGAGTDIFARSFWSDGSPQAAVAGTAYYFGEILVNSTTAGNQTYPDVAMRLAGDQLVVAWTGPDGNQNGVFARRFSRNIDRSTVGSIAPIGNEFQVNVTAGGEQTFPSVSMGYTGNFVVAWSGRGDQPGQVDVSGQGVFSRAYDAAANPLIGETRANNQIPGNQWMPSVACDANGNYVIVWTGVLGGGPDMTVYHALSRRNWADTVGPIVTGLRTTTGERLRNGGVIPGPVHELVVEFSENLSVRLTDSDQDGVPDSAGPDSVLNPDNWLLLSRGTPITAGVSSITFQRNPLTRKYEARVVLDGNGTASGVVPLSEGSYALLVQDTINDWYFAPLLTTPFFSGNRLDGDWNGTAGTNTAVPPGATGYLFNFGVSGAAAQFAGEFRINDSVGYIQLFTQSFGIGLGYDNTTQAMGMDADGDFVVVWTSYGQDNPGEPLGAGVYMRLFDRNNNPLTPETLVNQTVVGHQRNAAVAMDADGDFVVVWEAAGDNVDGSWGIWARRYNSVGAPLGPEFLVNTTTQNDQLNPAVAIDEFGNFVVVWVSAGQPQSYYNDIRAQLFNYRGERVGSEFRVNVANLPGLPVEYNPTVGRSSNGNFVVIWEQITATANGVVTDTQLVGRLYNAAGTALTGEFRADSGAGTGGAETQRTARNAKVVMDEQGGFIVVWEGYSGNPVDDYEVFYQRFDALGNAIGAGQVNMPQFTLSQVNATVGVDADGDFVVAWNGNGAEPNPLAPGNPNFWADVDSSGIFMRKYHAAGAPTGVQVRVNRTESGMQHSPSIAMTREGDVLVVWAGSGVGDVHGIFGRRFDEPTDTAGPRVTDVLTTDGQRLLGGQMVTTPLSQIVVVFSEDMMKIGPNSVTNPANYALIKDGVPISGGIISITYGLNPATNKWEAVLTVDGNGPLPGVVPLGSGRYELVLRNTLRDVVGNPLNATGSNPNGAEFRTSFDIFVLSGQDLIVNPRTSGDQVLAGPNYTPGSPRSVASDGDGEYVIVWRDLLPGSQGIYARVYNDLRWMSTPSGRVGTGPNPGPAILVTNNPTAQFASVARDADGDFVVVWEQDDDPTTTGEDWNVWARRFDATGVPFGDPFRVNSETEGAQRYPAVAMDVDGDFVVVWQSFGQDGEGWGIFGQRYSPAGYALGGTNEVQLITFTGNPRGTFGLIWDGDGDPSTANSTGAISFNGNAFEIASTVESRLNVLGRNRHGVQVNQVRVQAVGLMQLLVEFVGPGGGKDQEQLRVDPGHTNLTGGPGAGVFIQTLVEGLTGEFQVNVTTAGDQMFPAVAMDQRGQFVVTWTGTGQNGDAPYQTNVYARQFPSNDVYGPFRGDPVYGATNPRASWLEQARFVVSTDNIATHEILPGTGYDGVVSVVARDPAGATVEIGSGALLWTGYHILTAAHVVTDALGNVYPAVEIGFALPAPTGPVTITSTQIIVHPGYDPNALFVNDLAIIVLPQQAPAGAERYRIYRESDEIGKIHEFAGFGDIGQGTTGAIAAGYPLKYFGMNRYEVFGERFNGLRYVDLGYPLPGGPRWAPGTLLAFDFDSGLAANDAFNILFNIRNLGLGAAEAMTAPGDSGGPHFINGLIAGVTAGVLRAPVADSDAVINSSFGEIGIDTRVSYYASWIDAVVAQGRVATGELLVNQTIVGNQKWSVVALDADGDFVISWTSYGQDGAGSGYGAGFNGQNGIFARRFDRNMLPVSNEFQVNTFAPGDQQRSQIAMDADGDFMIVWESRPDRGATTGGGSSPTDDFGIYGRRYVATWKLGTSPYYGPNGELGGEVAISSTKLGDQRSPAVALSHTGDAVVVWSGRGALPTADQADSQGIYHVRLFQTRDDAPPIVADVLAVVTRDGNRVIQQLLDDSVVQENIERLIVSFSENLVADRTTSLKSITNPNNWTLYRNGAPISGAVVSVSFGLNQSSAGPNPVAPRPTNKYEAVLVVDGDPTKPGIQPLGPGIYELVLSDRVEDLFLNRLDGDFDGVATGGFTRGFIVGAIEEVIVPPPGPPAFGEEDPLVHRVQTGVQNSPAIASNASGDFVIVWVDYDPTTNEGDIYAQRFNNVGRAVGNRIAVNNYRIGNQYQPDVAMDDYGNFVVVWAGAGLAAGEINVVEPAGVFARVFDALGQPITDQFQVNQFRVNVQDRPAVAMDSDGDFVVAWTSYGQDSDKDGVFARRYTLQGVAKGPEFLVNTTVRNRQDNPDVAMDAVGNFVIVWSAYGHSSDGSQWGVFGQRYDAAGNRLGGEFRINTYTTDDQLDAHVAMDANGNFVVVWSSFNQDGSGYGIFGKRFNAAGTAIGSEFRINQRTLHWQYEPDVAMDRFGNFVVTWTSIGQDLPDVIDAGVFARIYYADGSDFIDPTDPARTRALGEFNVNALRLGDQNSPVVTLSDNGTLAFAWVGPDADQTGVYYRVLGGQLNRTSSAPLSVYTLGNVYQSLSSSAPASSSLVLTGTSGNDTFEFTGGGTPGSWVIKVNGVRHYATSGTTTVSFDGLGGYDTVIFKGTAGNETLYRWTDRAVFEGTGFVVTVSNVESLSAYGQGGTDVAHLYDSSGSDSFTATAGYGILSGRNFYSRAMSFTTIIAYSTGGTDTARFYGSSATEQFSGSPAYAALTGSGYERRAEGFRTVSAYPGGGNDVARLYDDPSGDDVLVATPAYAKLTTSRATIAANGYKQVYAYSSGGKDEGKLYDSSGNDTLTARPEQTTFSGSNFWYQVNGFWGVSAFSTAGSDTARLYDSAGDDRFVASPTYATLSGTNYRIYASRFRSVTAYASTGADSSIFYDGSWLRETFIVTPTYATMYASSYTNRAEGFRRVEAVSTGGSDTARLYGTAGNDSFTGTSTYALLTGTNYYARAHGFRYAYAYSGGGNDAAKLYGTAGADTFVGRPDSARLYNSSYSLEVFNFQSVRAYGSSGYDRAWLYDTALTEYPDRLRAGSNWVRMFNQGLNYENWVFDFEYVEAHSSNSEDVNEVTGAVDFLITRGIW